RRRQRRPQQRRRILLHHDAALEVEPCAEAEILVRGTRIAVVGGQASGEEGARRRLDVDHVQHWSRLDRHDRIGIVPELPTEQRLDLARGGRPAHGEEAHAVGESADETERAGLPGARLEREFEAQRSRVRPDALEDGRLVLRDAQRAAVVTLGVEEAGEKTPAVAARFAVCGDEPMDDRQLRERPDLDLSHRAPAGGRLPEGQYLRADGEASQVLDRPRERLVVGERDLPVGGRDTQRVAPPAWPQTARAVPEREAREVADTIVVVQGFLDDDRYAAQSPARWESVGPGPVAGPCLQPAMVFRGDQLAALGHQSDRRPSRPADGLDDGEAAPARANRTRELVEAPD